MNKKIKTEMAFGIILIISFIVGWLFWLNKKENRIESEIIQNKDSLKEGISEEDQMFFNEGKGGKDLGNYYRLYRGKIYYWDEGPQAAPAMIYIDADPNTFVSFSSKYCTKDLQEAKFNSCERYGKDSRKVFTMWYEIKDADPNSFILLGNSYKLGGGYSKDKSNVFYGDNKILNSDPNSFKVISEKYAKDNKNVYYLEYKIEYADPSTFELIDEKRDFAKDVKSYYWRSDRLNSEQLKNFYMNK